MNWLSEYIRETRAELKHVNWPTQQQTISFTTSVIIISLVVAFYLSFFDSVFILILEKAFLNI